MRINVRQVKAPAFRIAHQAQSVYEPVVILIGMNETFPV
jgi:hypothetical protein